MLRIFSIVLSVVVIWSQLAMAEDLSVIRSFTVNFDGETLSEQAMQQCDDSYIDAAEILMPAFMNVATIKKQIEADCPSIKVSSVESVNELIRFRLEGMWGCTLKFKEPKVGNRQGGRVFKIDLVDGC